MLTFYSTFKTSKCVRYHLFFVTKSHLKQLTFSHIILGVNVYTFHGLFIFNLILKYDVILFSRLTYLFYESYSYFAISFIIIIIIKVTSGVFRETVARLFFFRIESSVLDFSFSECVRRIEGIVDMRVQYLKSRVSVRDRI